MNLKKTYDVIVAGGGTTGCFAAIAAAESGVRVLLVEKLPFLGGNMTGGLPWLGFHDKVSHRQVVGGLPMRLIRELQKNGGATDFVFDPITGSAVGVNGAMLKLTIEKMVIDAGADVLLHSLVTGYSMKQGKHCLVIAAKGGSIAVEATVVIDCTDSGDLAELAGAKLTVGREPDHRRQVSSYVEIFGGINFTEMLDYFKARPDQIRPFSLSEDQQHALVKQMESAPVWVLGAFTEIIAEAKKDGIPYDRAQLIGVAYPCTNELMLVASRVEDVNLSDAAEHTAAEIDGLQQTWGILTLLRQYIPGCKNVHLVSTGAQLGIREFRHVKGDHILTADEMLLPVHFEDAVCCGAYHMDIHTPDHKGLESRQPPVYTIPYGSLVVAETDNVLIAGRCFSGTHEAMSSTRVAPIAGAQGEAAGVAAAIAVKSQHSVRDIPIKELQAVLMARDVIID